MIDMLHDNISFDWRWNHWPLSGNAGITKVFVEGPTLSIESVGWSGNDWRSSGPTNLSISVTLSTDDGSRRRKETAQDRALQDEFLPHITYATVVVAKENGGNLDHHLWFNIFLLSKALASRSSQLKTLKVIAQEAKVVFDICAVNTQDIPQTGTRKEFFSSPYGSLAGLSLQDGAVQGARASKGYSCIQDSTTCKHLNVQRPAHVRIDSCVGSSIVVKRSEWVYSSAENETPLQGAAHVEEGRLIM
jgi:hypothetical protein